MTDRFLPGMAHCNTQVHLIPRDMALDAKGRVTFSPIPEIAATLRASRRAMPCHTVPKPLRQRLGQVCLFVPS